MCCHGCYVGGYFFVLSRVLCREAVFSTLVLVHSFRVEVFCERTSSVLHVAQDWAVDLRQQPAALVVVDDDADVLDLASAPKRAARAHNTRACPLASPFQTRALLGKQNCACQSLQCFRTNLSKRANCLANKTKRADPLVSRRFRGERVPQARRPPVKLREVDGDFLVVAHLVALPLVAHVPDCASQESTRP